MSAGEAREVRAGAQEPLSGLEAVPSRWELLGEVFPLWLPMVFNNVMMLANEICNTICIGRTGNAAELAAVGLGNMMQNCCALSLGLGLTSALDTFVSQAHGAGQRSLCVQYLQRSRAVTATQLVWMIPLLWFSDSILLAVGQHADVARHAAAYNRAASLGLLGSFQFQGILSYLRNVGVLGALLVWTFLMVFSGRIFLYMPTVWEKLPPAMQRFVSTQLGDKEFQRRLKEEVGALSDPEPKKELGVLPTAMEERKPE
ncbi:DTX36, partial [Symbiodinium microadriaticum]